MLGALPPPPQLHDIVLKLWGIFTFYPYFLFVSIKRYKYFVILEDYHLTLLMLRSAIGYKYITNAIF